MRVLCGYLGTPTPTFAIRNESNGASYSNNAGYTLGPHNTWMDIASVEVSGAVECQGSNKGGMQSLNIVMDLVRRSEVYGGKDVVIVEGESVTLEVTTSDPSEARSFVWYKNGEIISGKGYIIFLISSATIFLKSSY